MIKRIDFNDGYVSEVTPSAIIPSGKSIYTGTDAPLDTLGNDGDIYLRSDFTIYKKVAGEWVIDSTLLVDAIDDLVDATDAANTATTNANNAATAANDAVTAANIAIADALETVIEDANEAVAEAIEDLANISFVKEKLDLVSNISADTWITIPNSGLYYANKISVALNGAVQTQDEDFELDTASPRTRIKTLVPLYAGDRLTFTIYN